MKYSLILFLSALLMMACSDAVDLSPKNKIPNADALRANQLDIGPVNPYVWTSLQVPLQTGYPFTDPQSRMMILPMGDKIYCIMGQLFEKVYKLNVNTKRWERIDDHNNLYLPFTVGFQHLFSYQEKIYYGLNYDNEVDERFMNAIDPVTGEYEAVPEFPGTPVVNPTCFVLGNNGYLMGGLTDGGSVANQYWQYNFTTHQWTNLGGMPGGARYGGAAIVLDDKVYFGLGYSITFINGHPVKRHKKDWLAMTAGSTLAIERADFPGELRSLSKSFIINGKLYTGWGNGAGTTGVLNDLWEYNPETNKWAQRSSCPAEPANLASIGVFGLGNAGYLVKGRLNQFWRYSNTPLVQAYP
jgi:N-acetylneuraminic acid mutarotase